jgi:hypothetical protein
VCAPTAATAPTTRSWARSTELLRRP